MRRRRVKLPRLETSPREQRAVFTVALGAWALWSWLHGGHSIFFVW